MSKKVSYCGIMFSGLPSSVRPSDRQHLFHVKRGDISLFNGGGMTLATNIRDLCGDC